MLSNFTRFGAAYASMSLESSFASRVICQKRRTNRALAGSLPVIFMVLYNML